MDEEAQFVIMKPNTDHTDIEAIEDEYKIIESRYEKEKDRLKSRNFASKTKDAVLSSGFSLLKKGLGATASLGKMVVNTTLKGIVRANDTIKQQYKGYQGTSREVIKAFEDMAYLFDTKEKLSEYKKPIYAIKSDSIVIASLKVTPPPLKYFSYNGPPRKNSNFERGEICPDITDIINNRDLSSLLQKYTPFGLFLKDPSLKYTDVTPHLSFDIDYLHLVIRVLLGSNNIKKCYWSYDYFKYCPFMHIEIDKNDNGIIRYDLTPNTINYFLVMAGFLYEYRSLYSPDNLNESIENIILSGNQKSSIDSIQSSIKQFRAFYESNPKLLPDTEKTMTFYSDLQSSPIKPVNFENFSEMDESNQYGDLTDLIKLYFRKFNKDYIMNDETEMRQDLVVQIAKTKFFD